jgi:magnesium chelatase family protein
LGSEQCTCPEGEVAKYHKKLSGPLLDRIDLQVELRRLTTDERFAESAGEQSPRIRASVEAARNRQLQRFGDVSIPCNAAIPGGSVREMCGFSEAGLAHYKSLIDRHTLSTRSMDRLAKVSRTVADLTASDDIRPDHIDKAASFVVGGILRANY